jgi:hypothetical protein
MDTNEEMMIARHTARLFTSPQRASAAAWSVVFFSYEGLVPAGYQFN